MNDNYNISNKRSPTMDKSHISILLYSSELVSSQAHLKKRSKVMNEDN